MPTMSSEGASSHPTGKKPRISLLIATAFGLGYLPKAPGTWGSLAGVGLAAFYWWGGVIRPVDRHFAIWPILLAILATLFVAVLGVAAASKGSAYSGIKDPQFVVIDEVSGQMISYFGTGSAAPNWKYLLLGFILFRVFDIWKPFPARQAESLPGGLGIMADDWIAGIYAALGLWIARAVGL